jgi:hypothetical protein
MQQRAVPYDSFAAEGARNLVNACDRWGMEYCASATDVLRSLLVNIKIMYLSSRFNA